MLKNKKIKNIFDLQIGLKYSLKPKKKSYKKIFIIFEVITNNK